MPALPFRRATTESEPAPPPRTAIIDIGSNSIRLVVYQGPARLPAILYNEKVMAGLGRNLAETGAIGNKAMAAAREALARFSSLAREMRVASLRTVATAAVRDAANGVALIRAAKGFGLDVELLSGEQEAEGAGFGVLSGIPTADGIVGDLGGGSLELVRVRDGAVHERASFPLGVLRIAPAHKRGHGAVDHLVRQALRDAGWLGRGKGLPFYLVGGSWRALGRLDMTLTGYPLPVIHQYTLTPERVAALSRTIARLDKPALKAVADLSAGRAGTLGEAAAVLRSALRHLGAATTVISAFGLREGLLYGALTPSQRAEDPLIVAARDEGRVQGRFTEHGDLLDAWVTPLFDQDAPDMARLRHAACLLADVGWRANPEFRAERGVDIALHGNWVAIDPEGRALVAQALFTGLGGGMTSPEPLARLAPPEKLRRAVGWGLAIRLGQRLSGGVAGPLKRARLSENGEALTLHLDRADAQLYSETVERRHAALASYVGLAPVLTA